MKELVKSLAIEYGALRYWGERMRRLQKEYFKTRKNEILVKSKTAEKKFDEVLADIIKKENSLPF